MVTRCHMERSVVQGAGIVNLEPCASMEAYTAFPSHRQEPVSTEHIAMPGPCARLMEGAFPPVPNAIVVGASSAIKALHASAVINVCQ